MNTMMLLGGFGFLAASGLRVPPSSGSWASSAALASSEGPSSTGGDRSASGASGAAAASGDGAGGGCGDGPEGSAADVAGDEAAGGGVEPLPALAGARSARCPRWFRGGGVDAAACVGGAAG